jgi:hypothetical protein
MKIRALSTQRELPVRRCTAQASAIKIALNAATAAKAPRYVVMQKSDPRP